VEKQWSFTSGQHGVMLQNKWTKSFLISPLISPRPTFSGYVICISNSMWVCFFFFNYYWIFYVGFVLQVEAEEQPEISEAFSVSSVPYFVFLKVPSFSFNDMLFWVVIDALFSLGSIQFVCFFCLKLGI